MPLSRFSPRAFFRELGPGLITGCADDDPSGIATYSIAGASLGYAPLWTAIVSFPLMAAVQLMCARLGIVTGLGLAAVIRRHRSRWVLWGACLLLIVANLINIAADLGGMGEAAELVTGVSAAIWTPVIMIAITAALIWFSYRRIAKLFKWITLVLLAYVATAFFARVDWGAALRATFVPHLAWSRASLAVLVGLFGTTISPYLFFWQASQEVEEERAAANEHPLDAPGRAQVLRAARTDVLVGMLASNVIMYFIILTTAATLHASGAVHIASAREAAEALRPLAGAAAYWLFTLGLIGTGMLGVPVLAGSSAYAIAEAAMWRSSLDAPPAGARRFYLVLAAAMIGGLAIELLRLNAVRLMFWSAVVNGALAPPLIFLVLRLTSDRRVMGDQVSSPALRVLGWIALAVMSFATVAMLVAT
jgi:NRAMP (natural resistance-associated macrophage protein)-like metal ion transporter